MTKNNGNVSGINDIKIYGHVVFLLLACYFLFKIYMNIFCSLSLANNHVQYRLITEEWIVNFEGTKTKAGREE